jgi:hypothetical protein
MMTQMTIPEAELGKHLNNLVQMSNWDMRGPLNMGSVTGGVSVAH